MTEKTGLLEKSIKTLRRNGLTGLSRKAALYLARRAAWRSDAWSKTLDIKISRDHLLREYGSLIKRNEAFRDRHKGRRCFVIGNGPSLREQDLSPLVNEITLVTNSFYLHPIVGEHWQPSYYFLSDPAYFEDSTDLSLYRQLTGKIRSAPVFVPHRARDFFLNHAVLPPERTYYIAVQEGLDKVWSGKPDLTQVIPGAWTVVQSAIMAAMYMGCSRIYLLGLDHDWLSHGGQHLNFYSEQSVESQPAGNLPGWTYKRLMESMMTMWTIYEMIQKTSQAEGIQIINATRGGFLDVFKRADFDTLFLDSQSQTSSNESMK
ncbi:MAG TPA: hypothetical protein VJV03_03430 [Pyrinomonadaceae bacterium]|nr:hypothetical protein [Pyrinomonadaceae bacterium]